jgi:hypothetical protein
MRITVDFEDVPYAQSSYKRLGMKGNRKRIGAGKTTTTKEVADILERKYHIVRFFLENHAEEVAEPILDIVNARLAQAMRGGQALPKLGKIGVKAANEAFVQMIKSREMDGKVPGVPTEASRGYTRKRLGKHKGFRVRRRPSFYDTGLYANAFRLKVEV